MSISPTSLRVRISSACDGQAWSGRDFLFACSEAGNGDERLGAGHLFKSMAPAEVRGFR